VLIPARSLAFIRGDNNKTNDCRDIFKRKLIIPS